MFRRGRLIIIGGYSPPAFNVLHVPSTVTFALLAFESIVVTMYICVCIHIYKLALNSAADATAAEPHGIGLVEIFVDLFGDCALVNTIFGIEHLLYCNPSRCISQSTLRNIWFPLGPPCFGFITRTYRGGPVGLTLNPASDARVRVNPNPNPNPNPPRTSSTRPAG